MTPEAPDGAFGHPLTEDYRPLSVHIQLPGALLTWAKRVSVCIACSFRSLWQGRRRRGSHSAIGIWVRPRHWPVSCVSKRPDSRNAKALAARVSSAGPTVAIEGAKRDELGLRDYLRGTSTETRLYVPTVVRKHLGLSDERRPARLPTVVFAREGCENGEARSDCESLRASDQSATGVLHG